VATKIKATCPVDGEVELVADDVQLLVAAGDVTEAAYSFRCPRCHETVVKHADQHIVQLLLGAGVAAVAWHGHGCRGHHSGAMHVDASPALTTDNVLDFILAMREGDDLATTAAEELV
jgi:hypothetical protein